MKIEIEIDFKREREKKQTTDMEATSGRAPTPSYDQLLGRLLRSAANASYSMTREEVKTLRECARERAASVSGGAAIATAASAFLAATGGWTSAALLRAMLLGVKGNAAGRLGVVSASCFIASGWLWTVASRRADNADASAGQCLQVRSGK